MSEQMSIAQGYRNAEANYRRAARHHRHRADYWRSTCPTEADAHLRLAASFEAQAEEMLERAITREHGKRAVQV